MCNLAPRRSALGEHNEFVLKEILHLSEEEIDNLYKEKALTTKADYPL